MTDSPLYTLSQINCKILSDNSCKHFLLLTSWSMVSCPYSYCNCSLVCWKSNCKILKITCDTTKRMFLASNRVLTFSTGFHCNFDLHILLTLHVSSGTFCITLRNESLYQTVKQRKVAKSLSIRNWSSLKSQLPTFPFNFLMKFWSLFNP